MVSVSWELQDIARAEGITLESGDAIIVYSGRETLQRAPLGEYYDVPFGTPPPTQAGLYASCAPFLRDDDVAALVWDMMDLTPPGYALLSATAL